MREKLILNQSIPIRVYTSVNNYTIFKAVYYNTDLCYGIESKLQELRKNPPSFMKPIINEIMKYETEAFCEMTFKDIPWKISECIKAKDGIMKQGIGNVMQTEIGYIQQENVRYDGKIDNRKGEVTIDYILNIINGDKMNELIDLVTFYMKPSFDIVQNMVQDCGYDYFFRAR